MLFAMVVVCAAVPALADDVFSRSGAVRLSLERRAEAAGTEAADLEVNEKVIRARFGVRREAGHEQLASSTAVAMDEVYLVRDAQSADHRVRVSVPAEGTVRVVLLSAGASGELEGPRPGRYLNVRAALNGQAGASVYQPLTLRPDGKYRLGQATGTWAIADGRLVLQGGMAFWGAGVVSGDGRAVTFSFSRGLVSWDITYERASEDATVASTRR